MDRLMCFAVCVCALSRVVLGGVINVPADHATIQGAIDAAVDGDEVVVAPGVYFGTARLEGKAITLRSTDPSDPAVVASTILDGGNIERPLECFDGETRDTVIAGLTIQNGGQFFLATGGGMAISNSTPTIRHCIFQNNSARDGGGLAVLINDALLEVPLVEHCIFRLNSAIDGSGIYNGDRASPIISQCLFEDNHAPDSSSITTGGGMANIGSRCDPVIMDCVFRRNSAERGGGMFNNSGFATVERCVFESNVATETTQLAGVGGGGLYQGGGDLFMQNCSFVGNTSAHHGGGLLLYQAQLEPTINGCLFGNNEATGGSGGGIAVVWTEPRTAVFASCTISGNSAGVSGGGVAAIEFVGQSADADFRNCIFDGNIPDQLDSDPLTSITVNFSIVEGGHPAPTNIDASALYIDPSNGNFRLAPGSPGIDAGDTALVPEVLTTDLDGNPRFLDDPATPDTGPGVAPIVDMGAYEFAGPTSVCAGDCDNSGTVDFNDLVSMLFEFGNSGDARCDADSSGTVDFNDLVAALFLFGACP